jgi:hypothetical protein
MSQAALSRFFLSGEDMDADLCAAVCDTLDACSEPEPTAEAQVACTLVLAHYDLLDMLPTTGPPSS